MSVTPNHHCSVHVHMIMGCLSRSLEGTAAKMSCFGSKKHTNEVYKWSSGL